MRKTRNKNISYIQSEENLYLNDSDFFKINFIDIKPDEFTLKSNLEGQNLILLCNCGAKPTKRLIILLDVVQEFIKTYLDNVTLILITNDMESEVQEEITGAINQRGIQDNVSICINLSKEKELAYYLSSDFYINIEITDLEENNIRKAVLAYLPIINTTLSSKNLFANFTINLGYNVKRIVAGIAVLYRDKARLAKLSKLALTLNINQI